MALSLADIDFLRADRASRILADYADADLSDANTLPLLTELRKSLSAPEAGAILTTLRLRKKAITKFPRYAPAMLFTEAGLQQASHPLARRYRAGLVESDNVLDLCCGIGADSLAFAAAGSQVLGLDINPARIAIARHNSAIMRLNATFKVEDIRNSIPTGYGCIFYDPSRRDQQGRRIRHVEHYQPPLSLAIGFEASEIIVKLSPGIDLRQLAAYGGQVEFVSVSGQLTEALLWLRHPKLPPKATLLTERGNFHLNHRDIEPVETAAPRAWLIEPDPAILRAGLVQQLAQALNAAMLDETIAYLTADHQIQTPWGRSWRILDWMPFQLKRLRRYLVDRRVGRVTVKKRGFPLAPEELIDRLRLKAGAASRVLVMTRHQGKPIAIICKEASFG